MSRNPDVTILTTEQYLTAAQNGINKVTACSRVRNLGWSIERAITTPVIKKVSFTDEELLLLKKNKITMAAARYRINAGWARERVFTQEVRYQIVH